MAKPPPTADALLKRVLKLPNISNVTINGTSHGITIRAYPTGFHPIVAQRREAWIRARGGSISVAEATQMTEQALSELCTIVAPDLDRALRALIDRLKEPTP